MVPLNTDLKINLLEFHHVGLLVESIEASIGNYISLFGKENVSDIIRIDSQNVNVCFVKIANDSYIELVESLGENSQVHQLLKKRITYYHIGYKVSDIVATVSELEALNYKPMRYFNSEAFGNKRCVFLFSPEAHLIELIER